MQRKTREQVIMLLHQRKMTLTELSNETRKAKSTIKAILSGLEQDGIIRPVQNEWIKKWIYYEVVPEIQSPSSFNYYTNG